MSHTLIFKHNAVGSDGKVQACDFCHARKIKCDRGIECQRCIAAGITCTRERQRRTRTRRLPNTRGKQFEDDEEDPDSITFVPKAAGTYQPFKDHGTVVSSIGQSNNTSSLIRDEIDTNIHLSVARSSVLRSALDIVKSFISSSQYADSIPDEKITPDPASKLIDFRIELLYMMMSGENERDTLALHWPDHISPPTLERMCLALMSGTVGWQAGLQYKLCVLYKATTFVSRWLRFSPPGGLSDYLATSREQYTTACLESLSLIDFSMSPSLAMLQALLSGATLVQLLGDTTRSWHLTALASHVVVSLGYHTSTSIGCDADEEIEIRRCVSWCYYMDKTLSMLLVRPASLPALASDPVDLLHTVPENPLSYKVKILVKLAQVQDISLSLMLKVQNEELAMAQEPVLVEDLQNRLKSISGEIRQSRQKFAEQPAVMIEWDAIDFTFFSIATSVLRLKSLAVQNHSRRQECLRYARRALFSMQACQKHISVLPNLTTDFLFWYGIFIQESTVVLTFNRTALLYPLTPIFVVFCNVVATSDIEDFELLKDVTSTISRIKDQCTFGSNLSRLLSGLVNLCSNLHDIQPSQPPHDHYVQPQESPTGDSSISGKSNRTIESEVTMLNFTEADANSRSHAQKRTQQSDCHQSCEGAKRSSIWDEGLMRELFNTHPSVEWLDYHTPDFQQTTHPLSKRTEI